MLFDELLIADLVWVINYDKGYIFRMVVSVACWSPGSPRFRISPPFSFFIFQLIYGVCLLTNEATRPLRRTLCLLTIEARGCGSK